MFCIHKALLVCFQERGGGTSSLMPASPLGLRWAADPSQYVTPIITSHLTRQRLSLLNYIDDFRGWGVAQSNKLEEKYYKELEGTLRKPGLVEAFIFICTYKNS